MFRSITLALTAAAALVAASPARAECKFGKIAELPVTMVGANPTVELKINGRPVRLLADSGAFFSMLPRGAAAELGLRTYAAPFQLRVFGVDGEAQVAATRVKTLTIAGVDAPNIEFLVGGSSNGALSGILGQNVLHIADIDYDFAHGSLNFMRASGCGDANLAYWAAGKPVSIMQLERSDPPRNKAVGTVTVNGVRLRALFDTGANSSVLTVDAARRAGIDLHGSGAKPAGATGGVGRRFVRSWIVPVASFKVGDEEVKNTHLRVGEIDLEPDRADMLLGADFFLSHHVLIANSQNRVFFTYNGGRVFDLSVSSDAPPPEPPSTLAATQTTAQAPSPAAEAGEPKDAAGYRRRGSAYAARQDYTHALADLTRAAELDPKDAGVLLDRAKLRLVTRQPFLAMSDLDAVLKLTPDDAEAHLLRAELRASGRDVAGERADVESADRLASKQSGLRLTLARLYTALDDYDRALAQYDQWIAAHPDDRQLSMALNGRCWTRDLAGRELDKALADCDAALRLMPRQPSTLDSRGLAHLRRGEWDRAIADYDAALAVQPKLAWALYGRGIARLQKGLATEGRADIAAAAAANPRVPEQAKRIGLAPPA